MNYNLTHYSLHGLISLDIRKDVWDAAFKYLKETNDTNGWHVMLYGA